MMLATMKTIVRVGLLLLWIVWCLPAVWAAVRIEGKRYMVED